MPCGKRPLVKTWDKPRHIRVITPSRYEQNEASVKVHWRNVIKELELSYKDEQFWESNCDTVRNLVGPVIFQRIAKIFELPEDEHEYIPLEETSHVVPSELFYENNVPDTAHTTFSLSETADEEEEEARDEESEAWTITTLEEAGSIDKKMKLDPSVLTVSKSLSNVVSKSFSRFISKVMSKPDLSKMAISEKSKAKEDSIADSLDDLSVHLGTTYSKRKGNPYYEMLYCNESETDMIKWKSNYKQKTFEVSASDEFSKRAEIMTKKISKDFYDWWVGLGNVEFKSEIKRPEDIEALFQVWFEEHASRGIVLDPKIIPCVIRSIAKYNGVIKASCLKALKRQIAFDIRAETSPAHTLAFGTSLPHKLKHVPPQNNTGKLWSGVKIPEDLRSMSCVWGDIQHLTSTKAFQQWLVKHPSLAMPPFLKKLHVSTGDKKSTFVVPSDFVMKDLVVGQAPASAQDLALPVSQFSLELKDVLSQLMNEQ